MRKKAMKNQLKNTICKKIKRKLELDRPVFKPVSNLAITVDFQRIAQDDRATYVQNIKKILSETREEMLTYLQLSENIHYQQFKPSRVD